MCVCVCVCTSVGTPDSQKGKPMSKDDMYGKFHLDLHSNEIKIKKIKYITSYFLRAARPSVSAAPLQIALYYNTNGTTRIGNEAEHYVSFP